MWDPPSWSPQSQEAGSLRKLPRSQALISLAAVECCYPGSRCWVTTVRASAASALRAAQQVSEGQAGSNPPGAQSRRARRSLQTRGPDCGPYPAAPLQRTSLLGGQLSGTVLPDPSPLHPASPRPPPSDAVGPASRPHRLGSRPCARSGPTVGHQHPHHQHLLADVPALAPF